MQEEKRAAPRGGPSTVAAAPPPARGDGGQSGGRVAVLDRLFAESVAHVRRAPGDDPADDETAVTEDT